ncbi:hypothetical protein OG259_08710 [Streptomyces sp. NBC_00250]|uniref:hypothetical protein n=1 Tax=Streptomyces sp. NBC_00250 TaxID=2903641 RepID=UPI002E283A4A|nr:hypothetical protein [Streptomyces sp. NBC_00250]
MSAPYERSTLAPSLLAYAKSLRDSAPDGPPPRGGFPLPDSTRPRRDPVDGTSARQACLALPGLLRPHLAGPDDGTPPGDQVAAALRRLAEEDPRGCPTGSG